MGFIGFQERIENFFKSTLIKGCAMVYSGNMAPNYNSLIQVKKLLSIITPLI